MKRGATVSTGAAVSSPVALALYVSQPTAYPGYLAFVRHRGEAAADEAAVTLEPVLYTGRPEGKLRGQCARILFNPLIGEKRRFLTGLRLAGAGAAGAVAYVGDCKSNYLNPGETGKTLIAVCGGPEPGRPGYLLLFVLKRPYARQRPGYNATYAQLFFRAYVRPRLANWLRIVSGEGGEKSVAVVVGQGQ